MRRAAALALVAALGAPAAASACTQSTPPDPRVPTWQLVNDYPLGAHAATPPQLDRYVRTLDRRSNRVRSFVAGKSAEGRPLRVAIVSSPRNLVRLGQLAARLRAVRAGTLTPKRVSGQPAFVWLGASVHGNEPSGGDADMRVLEALASGRTCADLAWLRRTVVFVLAAQNPDGRAANARTNARRFDLNRDWFARTQPETAAKIAALEKYPPMVFADQHEEGGTGFFFPPNADPIHHEVSAQALNAINRIVAPQVRRVFETREIPYTNYSTYDLFFMGYGDTVPSTLYGAAGMTFEKGGGSPYPARTREQFLAAAATIGAAVSRRRDLVTRWAAQWRAARRQGARGALQPNRVVQPDNEVKFKVPDGAVHGYLLRTDVHGGDAWALAERLRSVGVRVRELTADATVAGFRGYGEAAPAATAFPAGTLYVPMAQTAKHWVQALLGEDPYVPFPYFYDVSSWSNPLLMGLAGGVLTEPLEAPTRPAGAVPALPGAYAGGSEAAAEHAFAQLADGTAVTRPDGSAVRRPRVARLVPANPDSPDGWTQWLLDDRWRLGSTSLTAADVAAGKLRDHDVLVVPDGATDQLSPLALTALQTWVRGGGTYVGWRSRGLAVARAAALTSVSEVTPPSGFQVPGVALRIALDTGDPVAFGESAETFAFNTGDPILSAGSATVVGRYPDAGRFFVSGHAAGLQALHGTPAVTSERLGSGRVVLFAFDPVFRGYVEGTERLLANVLLSTGGAASTTRGVARPVVPAELRAPRAGADATIMAAVGDEDALRAAAKAAGVPRFVIQRDLTTVTLRVPDGRDAEGRWVRELPGALAAAGVRPLLAVL
jgi:hypothetical protein